MHACNDTSKVCELTLPKAIGGYNDACAQRTKIVIFLESPNQRMENRELILSKHPDPYAHTRNTETVLGHDDWRYKAAVKKYDIPVYSFQEADGISGKVLRREVGWSALLRVSPRLLTAS